jgi:hypothetical protein
VYTFLAGSDCEKRAAPCPPHYFEAVSEQQTQRHSRDLHPLLPEDNMPDDKTKVGSQGRDRINVHEEYEVRDWAKKFDVTPEELKKAVQTVGTSAAAVKKHLGK